MSKVEKLKNRKRNVVVAFWMTPEEAQELNVQMALSGLTKQDYLIKCCLEHEIRVVCGRKVARQMKTYLQEILDELRLSEQKEVQEEILTPLKHVLEVLDAESEDVEYGA